MATRRKVIVTLLVALALMLVTVDRSQATLISYLVSGAVSLSSGAANYQNASITLYVDPARTRWISWSRYNTLRDYNGQGTIDGARSYNFGVDDYFRLGLTDPNGRRSGSYTMDQNDAWGNSSGQQAIIYGTRSAAPDVVRSNLNNQFTVFDEAGIANNFFFNNGAGFYTFSFNFLNAWTAARGHDNFYLLLDVNGYTPNMVPEPATLMLSALGLIGVGLFRRRLRRS